MAGGMSAEAAALAREAQMRSEASEAARIAYVTQARTLRERRGSFIKMVVVSALVAAICSRLRGTVGALGFSISTGLVIWGVVDAVMLTSQIKVLDKRAADMMRPRDAAAKIAAAVDAGLLGLAMYRSGNQFFGGDGIVKKGVENTIANVGRLARLGMAQTDKQIIQLMMES